MSTFDSEELTHLAVTYLQQGKLRQALDYLQRAIKQQPQNAMLVYLMGMVYTQMGSLDRAMTLMRKAVQMAPDLYLAHFHIGLLLFNEDEEDDATEAWKALEPLGEEHPLVLFTRGLDAWSRDDTDACRDYLTRGLERNGPDAPFSAEMRQVLAWADEEDLERQGKGSDTADDDIDGQPAGRPLAAPPKMPAPFVGQSPSLRSTTRKKLG